MGTNIITQAVALCRRGAPYGGSDSALVRQGSAAVLAPHARTPEQQRAVERLRNSDLRQDDRPVLRELMDETDLPPAHRRVAEVAFRLSHWGPVREERPLDPDLAKRLAEAEAAEAAALLVERQALDLMLIAGAALRMVRKPEDAADRAAALKAAEGNYTFARSALERCRSKVTDVLRERDRRNAARTAAENITT